MTQPEQKSLAYAWFMLCAARSQARARGVYDAGGCKNWMRWADNWRSTLKKANLQYQVQDYPIITYTLSDGRVFKDGEAL